MSRLEDEVRGVLTEIADEARPVPLGRRALAGMRRRRERRTRIASAAAAVTLAAVVAPRLLGGDGGPAEPAPDLTGRNIVASYRTGGEVRVLNPATGTYRLTELSVEAVTADLRFAAGTKEAGYPATFPVRDPRVGVLDARTGELTWFTMPDQVAEPRWSPDDRQLVARLGEPGSPRAVVLNPVVRERRTVDLAVPAGRLVVSICWSDVDRLLAVTAPEPGQPAGTELMVFDPWGRRLGTVPIEDTWTVTCIGRGGRVLATRLAEQGPAGAVVPPEVAVVDLAAGTVGRPVRLDWAGAIQPVAWRNDDSFIATSQDTLMTVDLVNGDLTAIGDGPGRPPSDEPPGYAIYVPTDGLGRYAREVHGKVF